MKILVTGGAGFIGSALVRHLIENTQYQVVNVDKLTYAGNLESLDDVSHSQNSVFVQEDICQQDTMKRLFWHHRPDAVIHLAAESHVDRSIDGPEAFIKTNILGTYSLLEAAHQYWKTLSAERQASFRFLHVSTDEVFGDLGMETPPCDEQARYASSSPYSASKASSDHLVWAWGRSYGLPVLITHCSNNYGPYQFPEKLIPLMILNAMEGKALPVYGTGHQVRDWLYVEDHVRALLTVLAQGRPGESYNIGGNNQINNLQVVEILCELLEELAPAKPTKVSRYKDLITLVPDRPGHDERYAIDAGKIQKELGWHPQETFTSGIRKTVAWYLNNPDWCRHVQDGSYQRQRLGILHREAI